MSRQTQRRGSRPRAAPVRCCEDPAPANSVRDKTIAGVALVIDAVLLPQLLDDRSRPTLVRYLVQFGESGIISACTINRCGAMPMKSNG
jgi:hypothetical protein